MRTTERRVWKVRSVKPYPDAQNHLLVGEVIESQTQYVRIMCRTFHFGKVVNGARDVQVGPLARRIIPWQRIEIINELPESFDDSQARLVAEAGEIRWSDGHHRCPIVSTHEERSYQL